MMENLQETLSQTNFRRVFIHFDFKEWDLDNLIGRKAHTDLLINQHLMRILFLKYKFLFE